MLAADPNEASHARAREDGIEIASYEELMEEADVVVATTGKPDLIDPGDVRQDQIILALSNPEPEIDPIVRDGGRRRVRGRRVRGQQRARLPGHLPRRAPVRRATTINTEMKVAAAEAIAELAEESELVPNVFDKQVHRRVARAVERAAERSGAADPDRAATGL